MQVAEEKKQLSSLSVSYSTALHGLVKICSSLTGAEQIDVFRSSRGGVVTRPGDGTAQLIQAPQPIGVAVHVEEDG